MLLVVYPTISNLGTPPGIARNNVCIVHLSGRIIKGRGKSPVPSSGGNYFLYSFTTLSRALLLSLSAMAALLS